MSIIILALGLATLVFAWVKSAPVWVGVTGMFLSLIGSILQVLT